MQISVSFGSHIIVHVKCQPPRYTWAINSQGSPIELWKLLDFLILMRHKAYIGRTESVSPRVSKNTRQHSETTATPQTLPNIRMKKPTPSAPFTALCRCYITIERDHTLMHWKHFTFTQYVVVAQKMESKGNFNIKFLNVQTNSCLPLQYLHTTIQ